MMRLVMYVEASPHTIFETLALRVSLFQLGHFQTNECDVSDFSYNWRTLGLAT